MPATRAHSYVVVVYVLVLGAAAGLGALILYRIVAAILSGLAG